MKKLIPFISLVLIIMSPLIAQAWDSEEKKNDMDEQAIIIEVEGDPQTHADYLRNHHPEVEIISVYHLLFNGLAIKSSSEELTRLSSLNFVKAVHPVKNYEINQSKAQSSPILTTEDLDKMDEMDFVLPDELNDTKYTGKGVKVGIIDTGIDYHHPDLEKNYQDGYDLIDLDDEPMETTPDEGIPTFHGSHVAGIIAGNGVLTGVAPEAEIYGYRALGPGGVGSSVQIIAALEQAVEDDMDIINLSLGNDVNGPDYPTSAAVNKAAELGVSVVTANGNSGPEDWTVGSPATAAKALSIGALEHAKETPHLYDPSSDKVITPQPFLDSIPWKLTKDYALAIKEEDRAGKIALIQREQTSSFEQVVTEAEEQGAEAVLFYNDREEPFQGMVGHEVGIPVAQITKQEGEWLIEQSKQRTLYLDTKYKEQEETVADFSSRGPVTINWHIKPDVIAPGTDILSTVPGGYQILQGTSMAAPHVAGVVALIKEAKPNWSNEQINAALKTTTQQLTDAEGERFSPISQGSGVVQPNQALVTSTILYDSSLSFGKVDQKQRTQMTEITIENTTNQTQNYTFHIPKKEKGIQWKLPQSFSLKENEKKKIPIEIDVNPYLTEEGIHQGWLELEEGSQAKKFQLPYLYVNEAADYPKAMGFSFSVKPLTDDEFQYQIYLTDETKSVDVHLYNADTLIYDRHFLHLDQVTKGLNEGEITKSELGPPGTYLAVITVELANGVLESYESFVFIDPTW